MRLTSSQSNVIGAGCSCERHNSIFAMSLNASWQEGSQQNACVPNLRRLQSIHCKPWYCNAYRELYFNQHISKLTVGVRRSHVAESAVAIAARRSRFFNSSGVERFIVKLCIRRSLNITQLCTPRDQERRLYECVPASSSLSARGISHPQASHASHMRQREPRARRCEVQRKMLEYGKRRRFLLRNTAYYRLYL